VNGTLENAYAERFDRVLDYIDRHLDEDLSVEQMSRVANFSKFHFHRQFSVYAGISVFRYIQLLRLKRASYRLVFEEQREYSGVFWDTQLSLFKHVIGITLFRSKSN